MNLLRVKVDLLEVKNEEKVDILTLKILKQEEEIIKLKSTIDNSKQNSERSHNERELHSAKNNMNTSTSYNTYGSVSKTSAIPSSCKELSLIGHSLDGLYLIQNRETHKVETTFCDFEISGK